MLLSDIAELKMPRERKAPERFQHDQSHVTGAERARRSARLRRRRRRRKRKTSSARGKNAKRRRIKSNCKCKCK